MRSRLQEVDAKQCKRPLDKAVFDCLKGNDLFTKIETGVMLVFFLSRGTNFEIM
jgi:hypothetical protein